MPVNLEVIKITRKFNQLLAVDNVSFSASQGEIVGFLGPNGAGKSTTMKMITGYLTPTSGTAVINGHDILEDPLAAKSAIGYLPEGAPTYVDMRVDQFLSFIADIRGLKGKNKQIQINYVIEQINLSSVIKQKIDTLSKGFKRRLGLAQALMHNPDILILDEPTDGLDPNQKREVRKLIKDIAKNKVIVLSTHILEEVEAICGRVIVIAGGVIVADSTPEQLAAKSPLHNTVNIKIQSVSRHQVNTALSNLENISRVEWLSAKDAINLRIYPEPGVNIVGKLNNLIAKEGWRLVEFSCKKGQLDEVFYEITQAERVVS